MANSRSFKNMLFTTDTGHHLLQGKLSIAAGGLTTANTIKAASGSRVATGVYRIVLEESFTDLLNCSLTLLNTGSQALQPVISGSVFTQAAPYIDFILKNTSGAATSPQNPVAVFVSLDLKKSSVA